MVNDKCPSCRGSKKMLGMGMIMKPCWSCGGTGKNIEAKAKKLAYEKMEQANVKAKEACRKAKGTESPKDKEDVSAKNSG